mmetsp:Transcript_21592/g.53274  ORF Transcript_21592/g.53274 Transcript_21592/m.53274 type:complete len:110 (+) Transcript_21592:942-1271(+)
MAHVKLVLKRCGEEGRFGQPGKEHINVDLLVVVGLQFGLKPRDESLKRILAIAAADLRRFRSMGSMREMELATFECIRAPTSDITASSAEQTNRGCQNRSSKEYLHKSG